MVQLTIRAVLFLVLVTACAAHATMSPTLCFAEKVALADVIATGTVEAREAGPTLRVRSLLKGIGPRKIVLKEREAAGSQALDFNNLGSVIAFLEQPDSQGSALLVGCDGQGLWRQRMSPVSPRTDFEKASVGQICRLIKAIAGFQSHQEVEEQSREVRDMLASSDELFQLAALQWLLSRTLSESLPQEQRGTYAETMAAFALPLLGSTNSKVRGYAITVVQYACPAVAVDALLPLLEDKDAWCNQQVRVALGKPLYDCGLRDESIRKHLRVDANEGEDPEPAAGKAYLEQEWLSRRAGCVAKDVARLKLRLNDDSPLVRGAALVYLARLAGSR